MQHYGVPTRLLDWTEHPLVALFFALAYHGGGKEPDASVWLLNPILWNRAVLAHFKYDRGILTPVDDPELDGYKVAGDYDLMSNHPVALFGSHNSARIVAQRGVFTIFGKDNHSLDEYWQDDIFPDNCLAHIIIPSKKRREILSNLIMAGTSYSTVYPDLDGLARDMKITFGFLG